MLKLTWDFFLSTSIRTAFVIALCTGVNLLEWLRASWYAGEWKDEPHIAHIWFAIAGITAVVGCIGTFRRGKVETNFSIIEVAAIVYLTFLGPGHQPSAYSVGRDLRRFPSIESFFLGGFLITLWITMSIWKEEFWILRNCAIIGAIQIAWGLFCDRSIKRNKKEHL